MLSPKVCKLCALNLVTLALVVGLASCSGADVVREQSSRVEYAPVEQLASSTDQLDAFYNSVGQKKDSQPPAIDAPATGHVCSCQNSGEASPDKTSDEVISKSKASAKKIAKKYKVITISMPEDDQTDADAVIETKVEEQAEPQVAPTKDDGEVTEQAEPETEEAEGELQQEEKPQKSKSGKGSNKAIKGNKKSENKRSKREAGQKKSKRSSSKDKKSKRGGDSNKGKKGKK